MQTETRWQHWIAYFFGGAFLANTIPHLVNGISGAPFQSPFASPPGQGLSSSTVNVLWGMFNLGVAYVLLVRVGRFDLRQTKHAAVLGLGILLMSLMLAREFGKLHGGDLRMNAGGEGPDIHSDPVGMSGETSAHLRLKPQVQRPRRGANVFQVTVNFEVPGDAKSDGDASWFALAS